MILLDPRDNVAVCCSDLRAGDPVTVEGAEIVAGEAIALGHKIARVSIAAGAKILKYGAPIGSATAAIAAGDRVHLHNMKSDYMPAHLRGGAGGAG